MTALAVAASLLALGIVCAVAIVSHLDAVADAAGDVGAGE